MSELTAFTAGLVIVLCMGTSATAALAPDPNTGGEPTSPPDADNDQDLSLQQLVNMATNTIKSVRGREDPYMLQLHSRKASLDPFAWDREDAVRGRGRGPMR